MIRQLAFGSPVVKCFPSPQSGRGGASASTVAAPQPERRAWKILAAYLIK